ncbi:putative membrane protein YeiB [Streptomyces sp. SAI-170]
MAPACVDLAATAVRTRLALTGVALALTGYGGSWLALRLVPGAAAAVREITGAPGMSSMSSASPGSEGIFGDTPAGMLVATPHSEATLSIVGNTGVAILVITTCLAAMDAFPRLRRLTKPVIAVGSMSLTAYVYHIVAIWLLDTEEATVPPLYILLGFIASITVLATLWSRFFQRGPLERLMGKATGLARHIP